VPLTKSIDDLLVIIPARYASTRFPGKPLVSLTGSDGTSRPLIEWTWATAVAAVGEMRVVVATDDERIADAVNRFGGRAIMTACDLRNGTERCAAVVASMDHPPPLVINLQGDSPLVPAQYVSALAEFAKKNGSAMATLCLPCDAKTAQRLREQARLGMVGGTCVVRRADGKALYFSKYPIPFGADAPLSMHVGLYAYTPAALAHYAALPPSIPELSEGLEQLRFIDAGVEIDMLELPPPATGLWELNNPEDVSLVEAGLLRAVNH
jgi:3-deoxy-manno-octulosonate cytidylyltransferase (CMP-KDO synthetase)